MEQFHAMSAVEPRGTVTGTRIALDNRLLDLLRRRLPEVATHTIAAVTDEVPSYAGAFGGPMGDNIENAVQMALAGFLRLAARGRSADQGTPLSPALDGAYALGRGEARSGRSADALLSAYRVGARVAWRELSDTAVDAGVPADMPAGLAPRVPRRHAGGLRRAGVRLHRRAVGGLRRRSR